MERGDAFLSLAPGSMLQGIEITGYSDDVRRMGISRDEYLKRTKEVVSSHILHAIKEERSPVSFLAGGHYITITGIDKNGMLTYKESKNKHDGLGPDADRKISVEALVKKVVRPSASSVRMEWAADIKLSKDGSKLYGVPSEYLTVSADGKALMPTSVNTLANIEKNYMKKSGFTINRMNGSEGPDAQANLENNLKNGGVHMRQIIYLPEQLNMDVLKKQAAERSNEEEERLKNMSKDFFGIEYNNIMPEPTKEKVDELYSRIEGAYSKGITYRQKNAGEIRRCNPHNLR